ncbi:MAG: hypothetical protein AW07_02394 [Candidatus Accumulibacter sp. SK-11]|nr:MAG: hypothetical protein AW07_02394 [Candidatus Accumulibacter sp. SK-11]
MSSGCRDTGHDDEGIKPLTPRPWRNSLPQCMAMNACAGASDSLACTGRTSEPRRELTRTSSPARQRRRSSSCGCNSSAGSAACANSRPSVPVRLIVCHWSRSRPVVSDTGKRASRASASGRGAGAWKRARPSSVAKRASVYSRSVAAPPAANGHWRGVSSAA